MKYQPKDKKLLLKAALVKSTLPMFMYMMVSSVMLNIRNVERDWIRLIRLLMVRVNILSLV